jgi:hypothetical protein
MLFELRRRPDCVTVHVLILVPVFFALMKERALRRGTLQASEPQLES